MQIHRFFDTKYSQFLGERIVILPAAMNLRSRILIFETFELEEFQPRETVKCQQFRYLTDVALSSCAANSETVFGKEK